MSNTTEELRPLPAPTAHVLKQRRRAQVGSLIGTTIEWYEYYIYGATAALVFPASSFLRITSWCP